MKSLFVILGALSLATVLVKGEAADIDSVVEGFKSAMVGAPGVGGLDELPKNAANGNKPQVYLNDQIAQAIYAISRPKDSDLDFSCCNLNDHVKYDGKCFWAIVPGYDVKFLAADEICRLKGAKPANIYSQEHYDEVMAYLHRLDNNFYYVYTGMEFNPDTRVLSNYDGTVAQFNHWRSGDPVSVVADPVRMNRVAINILADPQSRGNGMLTTSMIWEKKGVLCEK